MIILHIAFITDNKANGVSVVVPKYVEEQSKYDDVALLNLSNFEIKEKLGNVKVFNSFSENISKLNTPFNRPDLVIFHEIYRYQFIKVYRELLCKKIPYIIIPHGSLNKIAQRNNRIKKKIGNILFFKRFVKHAAKIQFLSNREKSMSVNYNKESYVLGNGISIDKNMKKTKSNINLFKYIYVGRFDIKVKGIDLLLKACNYNKDFMRKNNIILEIYGKNSRNIDGKKYIQEYIDNNLITDIVKLNSEVYDKEKIQKLLDADIFIQTSRNEGQPLSVLEALGYGIPVIVTPGTNFSKIVEEEKMGWGATCDYKNISTKMQEAYKMSKEKSLDEYSKNAVQFIESNFRWEDITKKALDIYKETINNERN